MLLAVVAVLLVQARFTKRVEAPRKGDPAMRWLHGKTESTPSERDKPGQDGTGDLDADSDGP